MSSLLTISWCLPPLLFPRSIQVARTLKYLKPRGWDATVVCGDPRAMRKGRAQDEALAAQYAAAYRAVPVWSFEEAAPVLALWRLLPQLQMLPDARRPWIRPALRAARALAAAHPFDALVSFAQPWSDHLVALQLKRETGLPWLAHFSDPWVDSPYLQGPAWLRQRWQAWEGEVVRAADALVFVTTQTADLVMSKYPAEWRVKAHVVPHGYDADLARAAAGEPRPAHGRPLRLVYTGNFFAGRTPDGLLDALDRLSSTTPLRGVIEVVFVGQMPPGYAARITRAGLDDVVSCRGTVPFLEGLREAGRADVLLVVDAPGDAGSVFLPSKLVDYLMFRKPILGLTPAGGTAAQLLERLGCPVVPPGDPARIAAALQRLIDEWGTGRLDVSAAFDAVASEYSMETAAARLDGALRAIIGRGERSARG